MEKRAENWYEIERPPTGLCCIWLIDDFNTMRATEVAGVCRGYFEGRADAHPKELLGEVKAAFQPDLNDNTGPAEAECGKVLQNTQIVAARLVTEAAIFADKVAVDEETRPAPQPLGQLRELLEAGGAVGRKLDFLIQDSTGKAQYHWLKMQ